LEELPAELVSLVLHHLDNRDRLTLRMSSRTLESAVAKSHFRNESSDADKCFALIGTCFVSCFQHCGPQLLMSFSYFEELRQSQLLQFRRRLFKTASIDTLRISWVNFNKVPLDFINQLLEDCNFRHVHVEISQKHYNER
ncbi:hypothetical protein PFISCL1PPCAC_909, partial [Pristionchus fissidentatus]